MAEGGRTLDSWCTKCDELRRFELDGVDPGSAHCPKCGHTILLMKPVGDGADTADWSPR